jgi:hypothetical protein
MMGLGARVPGVTTVDRGAFMALVGIPGSAESFSGTVEIILRATRLELFTAAEAEVLIDRVRPHIASTLLPIQDSHPAGGVGQAGNLPNGPGWTV